MNLATEIDSELWASIRRSYESQAWSNAILDAVHHFSDVIRTKSGLQSDGAVLAGQAFGGKEPKIRLNKLSTESDRNVQAGVEQLVRGLYQAVRNPRSHERFEDSQRDCDALVVFVNHLLGMVGHAKAAFSIEGALQRINDENFVANERYAELILADIPSGKRLDTLIAAFEQRDANSSKQRTFFQACIPTLDDSQKKQFFEVVSSSLRISADDMELRTVFQILDPSQWSLVAEADRMRSENRVIRNIGAGRYSPKKDRCFGGALATWAARFVGAFVLRREVLNAIHAALTSGDRPREDYVFKYFFQFVGDLADCPPGYMASHIRKRLELGDSRYKDALESLELFGPEAWVTPFRKQLDNFKEIEEAVPSNSFEDDEIPF